MKGIGVFWLWEGNIVNVNVMWIGKKHEKLKESVLVWGDSDDKEWGKVKREGRVGDKMNFFA